jgi:inorganic phosphate transporter, PiT family
MTTFAFWAVVAFALLFDFVNGFHDAANSIATVVATRVLTPVQAVIWAASFNFIAFKVFGTRVAAAIAKGVVDQKIIHVGVIFAALMGAVVWNVLTAWLGLPSSSSHALVGGMVGAGVAKAGGHVVIIAGLRKIGVFILYSPLIGLALGFTLMVLVTWLVVGVLRPNGVPRLLSQLGTSLLLGLVVAYASFGLYHSIGHKHGALMSPALLIVAGLVAVVLLIALQSLRKPSQANKSFRVMQLFSAAAFSLGHGANDAQKTMGIIFALMIATGRASAKGDPPYWVVLAAHTAIGIGTLFGGWRIVRTMGTKLTKLQPMGGVCAETAAAITLFFTSAKGIPVSTTHTITGAIVGVGTSKRLNAVNWGIARRVVWAWILTIPGSALVAALVFKLIHLAA